MILATWDWEIHVGNEYCWFVCRIVRLSWLDCWFMCGSKFTIAVWGWSCSGFIGLKLQICLRALWVHSEDWGQTESQVSIFSLQSHDRASLGSKRKQEPRNRWGAYGHRCDLYQVPELLADFTALSGVCRDTYWPLIFLLTHRCILVFTI